MKILLIVIAAFLAIFGLAYIFEKLFVGE